MSLDITKVAAQIGAMAEKLAQGNAEHQMHLAAAAGQLAGVANPAALLDKVRRHPPPIPFSRLTVPTSISTATTPHPAA